MTVGRIRTSGGLDGPGARLTAYDWPEIPIEDIWSASTGLRGRTPSGCRSSSTLGRVGMKHVLLRARGRLQDESRLGATPDELGQFRSLYVRGKDFGVSVVYRISPCATLNQTAGIPSRWEVTVECSWRGDVPSRGVAPRVLRVGL